MAFTVVGRNWLPCGRDDEGHRTYKLVHKLKGLDTDGPANALRCPGLAELGSTWNFKSDTDDWAYCKSDAEVKPLVSDEPHNYVEVTQTFSTKPAPKDKQRCQDNPIENPLLEQPKISGDFSVKAEEATHDRFGFLITNSAHELMKGPQVEFDEVYAEVNIEMNVGVLNLPLLAFMNNKVNAFPLWGLLPRMIKCTIGKWERKFYGTCLIYYTIPMKFSINYKTWDRDILDEGTKVLNGHWDRVTGAYVIDDVATGVTADRFNPQHFIKFVDRNNNPCKVMLDGRGQPSGVRVVHGTFGASTATDVRTSTAATADAIAETLRLLVGAADLAATNVGAGAGSRSISEIANQLRDDFANLRRQADTANQLATSNGVAVAIQVAVNTVAAAFGTSGGTGFVARFAELSINANTLGDAPGAGPLTVQIARVFEQLNTSLPVTQAVATKTLVDTAMARIYADVNFTGTGGEVTGDVADPGQIHIEKYDEADFLLLGIPLSF